jgi:hypothetical protein
MRASTAKLGRNPAIIPNMKHQVPSIVASPPIEYLPMSGQVSSDSCTNLTWCDNDLPLGARELARSATKFDLVINPKTAKALDLTIPLALLTVATELIE